ncbi:MAG: hypothetical protein ACK41O_27395, partial [Runella zeae]
MWLGTIQTDLCAACVCVCVCVCVRVCAYRVIHDALAKIKQSRSNSTVILTFKLVADSGVQTHEFQFIDISGHHFHPLFLFFFSLHRHEWPPTQGLSSSNSFKKFLERNQRPLQQRKELV